MEHRLRAILQAVLYIKLIEISPRTLVLLLASAFAGAWCGAGIVARLPRAVQLGVGSALVALVGLQTMVQFRLFPAAGHRLGMAPLAAFPFMMGSSAFLMPAASARFLKNNCFDARVATGLALGGLPAVLLAALVVKSLPLPRRVSILNHARIFSAP